MDKRDYYEVLGVPKSADAKTIKSSFKKLAKKYHPDISKEDNAEEKFKKIQEAYAVLSDEQKKQQYDQFGHAAFDGMGAGASGFGDFDFSDIFSDIFGGGFGNGFSQGFGGFSQSQTNPNAPINGRDMEITLPLDFKEAVFGVTKQITIKREQNCKKCNGKGSEKPEDVITCPTCNGQGRVRQQQKTMFGMAITESVCPDCNGSGKKIKNPCNECHGSGRHIYKDDIEIKIPAGVDNGSYMKVTGKGEGGYNGGAPGDLYLNITVQEDDFFKRDGLDIKVDIPVAFSQAVLGDTITMPTIHGDVDLKIPKGTQSGSLLKLKGKGIHADNVSMFGKTTGDQFVRINIKVPTKISKEEEELIQKLSKFNDKHTDQKNFFEKIKKFFY